ncbi:MAG: four helix bundle protein [Bacteroidetes bacterium]|nr:four helix bundle protein [Bacteroidota bacterium]
MAYKDFTQMSVWKKAKTLLVSIYSVSKQFPDDEKFGPTSDIRRAANSVAHNIAEGYGRFEGRDKSRFYKFSRGSAYEVTSQLIVSTELKYLKDSEVNPIIDSYKEVITELDLLIKTVENK